MQALAKVLLSSIAEGASCRRRRCFEVDNPIRPSRSFGGGARLHREGLAPLQETRCPQVLDAGAIMELANGRAVAIKLVQEGERIVPDIAERAHVVEDFKSVCEVGDDAAEWSEFCVSAHNFADHGG